VLSGSARIKAAHRLLMKLTPEGLFKLNLPSLLSVFKELTLYTCKNKVSSSKMNHFVAIDWDVATHLNNQIHTIASIL